MSSYLNLIVIDLSSYGSALAIINQFCDDQAIKVFEVSPVGQHAVLILLIKDDLTAEILKKDIFSFYKASVLSLELLKNFNPQILNVYLSQNKVEVLKHLITQEFSFAAEAFQAAEMILLKNVTLIDFRLIRTCPLNAIIVATSLDLNSILSLKKNINSRSCTIIENVENPVKEYFQIVKN